MIGHKKVKIDRRGFYFTLDALLAFVLLLMVIMILPYSSFQKTSEYYKTSYLQEDALQIFSSVKTIDVNNVDINGIITDSAYNETLSRGDFLIESVSKLWAINGTIEGKDSAGDAKDIASEFFGDVFDSRDNIGLFFNNGNNGNRDLIFVVNDTPYQSGERFVIGATNFISGISKGRAVKGNTARAFLRRKESTRFVYFGGYIGDGNITSIVDLSGMTNISNISMEIAINHAFDFFINDEYIDSYSGSSDPLIPRTIYFSKDSFDSFINGTNTLEFGNSGTRLAISGGYIRIDYKTDAPEYKTVKKQSLHQIEGVINEYDSIYAPNTITSMELRLHYNVTVPQNQNTTLFFRIGNVTIYSNTTKGPVSDFVTVIDSSTIKELLNGSFDSVSNRTVPIRLGFEEFGEGLEHGNADVILITDISKSMNYTLVDNTTGVRRNCDDEDIYDNDTARVSLAECLDKKFVDLILSVQGNRVALVSSFGDPDGERKSRINRTDYLMTNATQVKAMIDEYDLITGYDGSSYDTPIGGSCLCCAINSAYKILNENSNSSRKKYVISMSDGLPIYRCRSGGGGDDAWKGTQTGYPNNDATQPIPSSCGSGQAEEMTVQQCTLPIGENDCKVAIFNANYSACRIYNDLLATVYSIGFGPVKECQWANTTLQEIATCGHGKYFYSSNATELEQIYQNISQEIVGLSYVEQQINVSGDFDSILYNDSYIKYDYDGGGLGGDVLGKFGSVVTYESDYFEDSRASFSFSSGIPLEAIITSYSGPKWTKTAFINNTEKTGNSFMKVFNLSDFGRNYNILGDPFRVNIPIELIASNELNTVELKIGNTSSERNASDYDKIIYTLLILSNYSYSKVAPYANGCNWSVEYYNGLDSFLVPENYSGPNRCYYNSTIDNDKFKCADTNEGNALLENDAIVQATYYLLRDNLDKNPDDCKLDIKASDFYLSTMLLPSVPFLYYSKAEFLSWR